MTLPFGRNPLITSTVEPTGRLSRIPSFATRRILTQHVCLEWLENILKIGEADKSLGNNGGVNLFAQMIDEAEGLEKVENLQSHDNTEIYEKAVKILETYWLEEDDTMPPGDGQQTGFQFGGGDVPSVPSGGFNFS